VWTSSLDGQIGTGTSFTRGDLSVGDHNIVLTATDSDGAIGTDAVAITIASSHPCFAGSVSVGETVSGTLASGDCQLGDGSYADRWLLVLASTTAVQIDMTSNDFDTYLILSDDADYVIAQDDDGGTGLNSRIQITLSAGAYGVWANSYAAGMTGTYQVSVSTGGPVHASRSVESGKPLEATLKSKLMNSLLKSMPGGK